MTDLTEMEIEVLIKCAKIGMGINSNKRIETIAKRFPPRKREEVKKAVESLRRKGYLRLYKSGKDLYCFTKEGLRKAIQLLEDRLREQYPGYRF